MLYTDAGNLPHGLLDLEWSQACDIQEPKKVLKFIEELEHDVFCSMLLRIFQSCEHLIGLMANAHASQWIFEQQGHNTNRQYRGSEIGIATPAYRYAMGMSNAYTNRQLITIRLVSTQLPDREILRLPILQYVIRDCRTARTQELLTIPPVYR